MSGPLGPAHTFVAMGVFHEAIVQLRGDGGQRQVAHAETAVVSSGGLTPAGALLLTVDG